jgi:Starter unit:ACP transacylase in aflatoxin biosynthesis
MATPRSILFFADGSQETHSGLRKILNVQTEGSLLSRFLNLVASALQNEVYNVASVDRDGLPDFHDLHGMVQENFEESARHPALHPTEIVLVQLANFIA